MSFTLRAVLAMAIATLFVPQPASSQLLRNGQRPPLELSVDVEKWVRALQHTEADVRKRAMNELETLAEGHENMEAALPTLRQCADREFPFPTAEEAMIYQDQAWEILTLADPDFIAVRGAKILAENFRYDGDDSLQNFVLRCLRNIDQTSVDIDADLLRALERGRASNIRTQIRIKYREAGLLHVYAKLATDRERAAQVVLSRMKWPFGQSCYEEGHFQAVRLCAEHCPSLLQPMVEAYRADADRGYALMVISSLAVHHDDAWEFFVTYLQDEFAERSTKRRMATAFADTWLLAAETTQRRTLDRIEALHSAADWLDWPSSWGGRNTRLLRWNRDPYDRSNKEDVMALLRTRLVELRSDLGDSAAFSLESSR